MTVATTALLGQGIALKMGNGASPQAFSTISQINDISGFGLERALEDVTHYQSTAHEFIGKMPDPKQFTAKANYLPNDTTQLAVQAAALAGAVKDFQLFLPAPYSSNKYNFSAVVLGWSIAPPVDAKQEITFTFKISGTITYTP
jgi:hypothetical protein